MVVGESVYNWSTPRKAIDNRYELTSGLRKTHHQHALNPKKSSKYVRNIERAIFCRSTPLDAQKLD
jgi:hypothetical protein